MKFEPMHLILAAGAVFVVLTVWLAHRSKVASFDAFDLIMEDGKASPVKVAFMLVLAVSTWVIVNQEIRGKLSDATFGLWLGSWVLPLVAKVIFNAKEMPNTSTLTVTSRSVETTKESA